MSNKTYYFCIECQRHYSEAVAKDKDMECICGGGLVLLQWPNWWDKKEWVTVKNKRVTIQSDMFNILKKKSYRHNVIMSFINSKEAKGKKTINIKELRETIAKAEGDKVLWGGL